MSDIIPNNDSRAMQPLPWRIDPEDDRFVRATSIISASRKQIATFWGNDDRGAKNLEWCTEAQRLAHAQYAIHACNSFPLIQTELERIYGMEDMPEEAVKAIEILMKVIYYEGVPSYAP